MYLLILPLDLLLQSTRTFELVSVGIDGLVVTANGFRDGHVEVLAQGVGDGKRGCHCVAG